MAFKTTIKVAMLTGAAKDDVFTTESTGLSEDLLTSALNVLGNDPGSASLYSLAQESLGTGQMPVEGTAYSLVLKAKITIRPDGRIDYDGDAIASTLAHFAEGAIITDSFTYTVRMANGALSTAMVTLEITGENDAPTLRSIDPVTLWDSEADDGSEETAGDLHGIDVDDGAVLTYQLIGAGDAEDGKQHIKTDYGTLTLDTISGHYTFITDPDKIDTIAQDAWQTLAFQVQVSDGYPTSSAPQDIVVLLKGANDAPTLGTPVSFKFIDSIDPDGSTTQSSSLLAYDVDHDNSPSPHYTMVHLDGVVTEGVRQTLTDLRGTFTLNTETGKYAYTVDGNYIDRLHSNPLPISVDVQAVDAIGATSAVQTIMINFEATNDVPLFSGQDSATVIEGDVALVQRKLGVTDPDTQFGFKPIEPADLTGTYGVFTFNRKSGDWTYKLNNESPLVTDLTANDEKTDVLTVYWSTGESHDLSVKVKGIDAPTTPIDPVKTFFFTPRFDQEPSTTYEDFTNNDFLKLGLNITIDRFSRASSLGPNGVVEAGTLIDLSMSGGTAESPEKAEFTIFLAGCTDFSLDQASNLTT
jgi:VCBS repeat-containing protein